MRLGQAAVWLVVVTLVGVGSSACRSGDHGVAWGWKGERPANALAVFSHKKHEGVFAREGLQCFACHTMAARIDDAQEAAAVIRGSKEAFFGGKDACHSCHYNAASGNTAPDRCSLCHLEVRDVQPANHNHDWMSRHAVFAKVDAQDCESCHRPRYCQECHNRRDLPVRTVHDTNVRFTHGIEARANPMKCGECHTSGFCQRCHVEGGYEK